MRRVFVDTGAFFALIAENDRHHAAADRTLHELMQTGAALYTTNVVVSETYTLLLRKLRNGRVYALQFLVSVRRDCAVEFVVAGDQTRAEAILKQFNDQAFSHCDALSFAVMERLGIDEAIAYDAHFTVYGRFSVLQ